MKKILPLLIILLLTGCTSYYEDINNLAIIDEIGIDYVDNYRIYIKVLSSNQEEKDSIYTETCDKLNECFNSLNNKLTKKLYLTHLNLLIFSDTLEKDNYKEIMNYFLQESTSRNTFATIITDNINDNLLNRDSKEIQNLLDLSIRSNGVVREVTFDNIIKDILNYKLAYIPFITSNIEIKGYKTIYDENKKLSEDESIILNFILNKIDNVTLLINNKNEKLENCETIYKNNNNNLIISLTCNYQGNNKDEVLNYINNSFNNFIKNNSLNYFYYLKEKYAITGKLEIINDINIISTEIDSGDYFE